MRPIRSDRRPADGSGARRARTAVAWVVALGFVLAAALLVGAPVEDRPLDPTSAGPHGLRGVVDLLEEVGVDVTVSLEVPADTGVRAFVPLDLLSSDRREGWRAWVEGGGTLVVADAGSPIHGLEPAGLVGVGLGVAERAPDCVLPALVTVGAVAQGQWPMLAPAEDLGATPVVCFGDGDAGWLVTGRLGAGTIVALGSADPFTNALLDRSDNVVLAAVLLGPEPGDELQIVPRPEVGEGDRGLAELIDRRVWDGMVLLLLALLAGVVWRSRRLGRPVAERLPPVLPGAELTRSIADLHQRAGARQAAADQLRKEARRRVAEALRSTSGAQADLAARAAARLVLDPDEVARAVVDCPVPSDRDLLAVSRAARRLTAACDEHARAATAPMSDQVDSSTYRQND